MAPISGTSSIGHLRDNLAAASLELPAAYLGGGPYRGTGGRSPRPDRAASSPEPADPLMHAAYARMRRRPLVTTLDGVPAQNGTVYSLPVGICGTNAASQHPEGGRLGTGDPTSAG